MKKKLQKIPYYLLIALGLLHVVGHVLDNVPLRIVAFATHASPLPLPFSKVEFAPDSRGTRMAELTYSDGKKLIIPYRQNIDLIKTSHRGAVALQMVGQEIHPRALREQIFRFAVCNPEGRPPGPVLRVSAAAGLGKVQSARLFAAKSNYTFFTVQCE